MYIERDITSHFRKISENYGMVALVGLRQAGKTTFLRHQMKEIEKSSYVLFDDPDAISLFEEDIKKFRIQYIEGQNLTVLDEVQYCEDAGGKLKYLVDTGSRLWITSSSETLLRTEVLSYLVGRISIIRLYPFTLNEFLRGKGQKALTEDILRRNIWEHMLYGGFPRVVTTKGAEMKRIILRDLYETMLLKDVVRTFSIDDIGALERLISYLAANVGAIVKYESISTKLDISFKTLKRYLDALTQSYFIALVKPFHTNKTKEISKQPKAYFLDLGLRNAVTGRYESGPDGRLFENYVLSELLKMGLTPKYWRTKTGAEVDFIIETGGELVPVEVKLKAFPPTVGKGLRSFIERYRPKKALIVSYAGSKGEMKINGCTLKFTDVMGMEGELGGE